MKNNSEIDTLEVLEKKRKVLPFDFDDVENTINQSITNLKSLEKQLLIQMRLTASWSNLLLPLLRLFSSKIKTLGKKPQLQKLSLFADNLPLSWGKIVKASAADYEDRINELWGAGKYKSAKWNQKLAWLCALSNLGHYLWLKAWKPLSTVFRRLL